MPRGKEAGNDDNTTNQDSGTSASSSSNSNDTSSDLSGEAAGVVRGVSRSIVRAPLIGRLPATAPKVRPPPVGRSILRRRVPARRVARVSDRVSTGLDWYASALEVDDAGGKTPPSATRRWLLRARSFAWNLFRNTVLGMMVFESYGHVVGSLAPPLLGESDNNPQLQQQDKSIPFDISGPLDDVDDGDDEKNDSLVSGGPDEYTRASLPIHLFAGATAGCIHGLASSILEGNPTAGSMARYTSWNTCHHSAAHAMLFGSYEAFKRGILNVTADEEQFNHGSRAYHLITFALAGGLAGQVQHLVSHFAEQALGLADQTLLIEWKSSFRSAPALRPVLWAFPPSAIGFIAFEYGKQFTT